MYKTIEALYKDGKIIPLDGTIPTREAKVLITFLDVKKRRTIIGSRKEERPEAENIPLRRQTQRFYAG